MTQSRRPAASVVRHTLSEAFLHDLRTPLNQIIGYSEMLAEQAQEDGQDGYVMDLQKIHAAGWQLLGLLNSDRVSLPGREPRTVKSDTFIAPDMPEPAVAPLASGVTKARIIVVDDIEANRDMLSRRLERQGYDVVLAENGREAMEVVRGQSFDLVLLDIMMPEMDGYAVLQQLKADESLCHIPVLMISALDELESVVRCIDMGAEDYLVKPFEPTLLKARIRACLEKKIAHDREMRLFGQCQQNYVRLQELEKSRDDLTHMIIHDLRTPLTSVISGMQTLETLGDLNPDQQEMMSIALTGGHTLLDMINDLLDISKMESGALHLDYTRISATKLVSDAVSQVTQLASSNELILVQQIDADLPSLWGDEHKLLRTLVNLLGNAIKFTPCGGTVTVTVQKGHAKGSVRVSVSDTGEGIPPEALGRIFEKFGQVESRQRGHTLSTGLGLTFCKLAVEAHGGTITVHSVVDKGSTFAFTLPPGVD